MDERIIQRLEAHLADQGLRRTKQRDVIVEAAFATDDHFKAEELLDKARKLGVDTVTGGVDHVR